MSITKRELKNGKIVYDNAFMYKGIRYKKRGFKSKGEAENWEITIKYEVNKNGSYFQPCEKRFFEVYEEFFSIQKDKMALNTISSYNTGIHHIKKNKVYKMKILDINYSILQSFFNELAKDHSKSSCEQVKKVFNATFTHAIKNGYMSFNPMQYVKINVKKNNKEKRIITNQEFIKICNYFLSDNTFEHKSIYIALCIGYYTGARISEVMALTKNDIDFEHHTISFNKRLEYRVKKEDLYISTMKTQNSYATLPLAKPLKNLLEEWFEVNPYENIVCFEDGSYPSYNYIQKHIKSASKELGIPFHFHMLRHLYATNLVKNNVNISVAKKLLRHAKVETTLDIYTHTNFSEEQKALESVFSNNLNDNYPKITPKVN